MIISEKYKYSELTGTIIGCAMEVHKILGNGFQEVIYQRALEKEMYLKNLNFAREFDMPILYKEKQIGTRRVDFFVEGIISVELKALTNLEDVHLAQAINYLEAYHLEIGLLINFGARSLEYRRLINSKYKNV
ncbi:MAG: GxxExxY protein [Candidatus Kapabacteria bacterium]|jgi:GxxExxY protein|nr:GxxExxY protein [Candidatus Kapabacteria bacterium]